MAMSILGLFLLLVAGAIGFAVGLVLGERRGRRAVQQGFPVMPVASRDQP